MVTVYIVRAFIADGVGGNLAGVVLDAEGLSKQTRQRIAAAVKLSEVAFLSASPATGSSGKAGPADHYRIEFFTPTKQIDLCGHATVAAYSLLQEHGRLSVPQQVMESVVGEVNITLRDSMVFMSQAAPLTTELDDSELDVVLESLRMDRRMLHPQYRPQIVSTGNPFLIIGVKNAAPLLKVTPNHGEIAEISAHYDLIGYYLFTQETRSPSHHAAARMFAPHYGIKEESATGMAAGPLGCVLAQKLGVTDSRLTIEQGTLMKPPSPSLLIVELVREGGVITGVQVGGRAKLERVEKIEIANDP